MIRNVSRRLRVVLTPYKKKNSLAATDEQSETARDEAMPSYVLTWYLPDF